MKRYVIRKFDPAFGQVEVHFLEADVVLCIDLPIKDNKYPTGQELDNAILQVEPTWHFERKKQIAAGVSNADEIAALVEPFPVVEHPTMEELVLREVKHNDELAEFIRSLVRDEISKNS